ncbi:hypothetical protein CFB39_05200 [Burkholderia sp. AU6039]|nr:hypothetical protein CFB39_05200 [Burkholderia sp. AU6039]
MNSGPEHDATVTSKALDEKVEQPLVKRGVWNDGGTPRLAVHSILSHRRTKLIDESARGLYIAITRRIDPERELITPTVRAHCALTQSPLRGAAPAG